MFSEPEEIDKDGDDYYTFLNIPRNASEEDISNAYRRLSRMYHPDKHTDTQRKLEAEILFSKTKIAYEVLSNPHKRAIYDNLGTPGLETQGWEVVQRTKTPQEIREEYEALAREREERRLQVRTNPKSTIVMNIDATEIFNSYDDDSVYYDLRDSFGLPHIEISSLTINQTIEAPLTSKDTVLFAGHLTSQNGTGIGHMNCSLRRLTSDKGWGEVEIGAGNGLNVSLKGFRNFSRGLFGNCAVTSNFTPNGIGLGSVATIANSLDKHTIGYLTWKAGMSSGMSTMVIRETLSHTVVANMFFGLPHTYFSLSYTHKMPNENSKLKVVGKVGTFGAQVEYGAEKKVSMHSSLAAHMTIGVPTGIRLKIKLHRATQTYSTSILLCDDILPAPIIYGTVIPIVGWLALQKLIIQPYMKKQKLKEMQIQREQNRTKLLKRKQEATSAVELMRETVKRIVEQEENKHGLVILQAIYGRLVAEESESPSVEFDLESQDIIEVTIPLQCLVKDSKLILQDTSKCQLPGFYDPCPGEDKFLRVRYLFRAVIHIVTLKDEESLRIPKQSHRVDS